MGSSSMITNLTVRRQTPVLVSPARATPRETKFVSDIDGQQGLRFQLPIIMFYRAMPWSDNYGNMVNPAKAIREALAETLVFYYPLAGRLREVRGGRRLAVDCTGEGVLFIEADTDATLDDLNSGGGHQLQPPFPFLDEVLFHVSGSSQILHSPLLLIQVTRLRCGGFILAVRMNHAMVDTIGIIQFINSLGEIIRGASKPSVTPVWMREIFKARDPPQPTFVHREYDHDIPGAVINSIDDLIHKSFFLETSDIKKCLPSHLHLKYSTFDVLTAFLWRSRIIALQPDPKQEVRVISAINARGRFGQTFPKGYYGNSSAYPTAVTTAGKLVNNPLAYAVELVVKAKLSVTEEYMQSVADLMVARGQPHLTRVGTYAVVDMTRAGLGELDIGWGKPAYGGIAEIDMEAFPGATTYCIPMTKNVEGNKGILVPIKLPRFAMKTFVREMEAITNPNGCIFRSCSSL